MLVRLWVCSLVISEFFIVWWKVSVLVSLCLVSVCWCMLCVSSIIIVNSVSDRFSIRVVLRLGMSCGWLWVLFICNCRFRFGRLSRCLV